MAETIPEFNPLLGYAAKLYCHSLTAVLDERDCHRDQWVMPKVYEPVLALSREKYRVNAELSPEWKYALYHEQDMILWRGSVEREQVVQHFKGRIGERVLALVLSGFIDEIVAGCHRAGYTASKGWLVKEKREEESRPYHRKVIRVQGPYALQHDRRTTFKLLHDKSAQEERDDDTLAAVRKRIELFHKHTEPVLEFYHKKRLLVEVDGEESVEKIHKEIMSKLHI